MRERERAGREGEREIEVVSLFVCFMMEITVVGFKWSTYAERG